MAGKGGRTARFTHLQKQRAIEIANENFGSINDVVLDRIQREIGRRPTRQVMHQWLHGRSSTRPKVDTVVTQQISTDVNRSPVDDVDKALTAAPGDTDVRTALEKLEFTIDALLDLSKADLAKLAPDKRLRLLPQLFETWTKLRQIDPLVLAVSPQIRQLADVLTRKGYDLATTLEDLRLEFESEPDVSIVTPRGQISRLTDDTDGVTFSVKSYGDDQ